MAIDQQKVVLLVLLYLSAALGTIDHSILLKGLSNWMGIKGKALKWFQQYLSDRYQYVKVEELYLPTIWCATRVSFRSISVQHLYDTPW